ncbi:MAG: hypothetical protein JNK63_04970, partial [Chthonomonas sp.]|nr:hypothetical protein [Chthonomonas sp.]
ARWLTPTELRFEGIAPTINYPKGTNDQYEGDLEIEFQASPSGPTEFQVTVQYQACTETECLAPDEIVLDGVFLPA